VHEGLCTSSGQAVAVKVVKHVGLGALRVSLVVRTDDRKTYLWNAQLHVEELTLWAHLSHPNILPFYGIFRDVSENGGICLVSPWMDNGNLHEYSRHCPQPERFRLVRTLSQSCSGDKFKVDSS
jgi:serine/threonine protein kinase